MCNEKTPQLLQLLAGLLRRKGGNTERKEKQMTEDGKGLVLVLKNKTTKKETEKNTTTKPLPRHAGLISVFALLLPKPPRLTVSVRKQLRMPRVNSPPTSPSANKLFTLGVDLLLSLGLQPRNLFRLHCSSFLRKGRTPQKSPQGTPLLRPASRQDKTVPAGAPGSSKTTGCKTWARLLEETTPGHCLPGETTPRIPAM